MGAPKRLPLAAIVDYAMPLPARAHAAPISTLRMAIIDQALEAIVGMLHRPFSNVRVLYLVLLTASAPVTQPTSAHALTAGRVRIVRTAPVPQACLGSPSRRHRIRLISL